MEIHVIGSEECVDLHIQERTGPMEIHVIGSEECVDLHIQERTGDSFGGMGVVQVVIVYNLFTDAYCPGQS